MKITPELLASTASELSDEELDTVARQMYDNCEDFMQKRILDMMVLIVAGHSPESTFRICMTELTIALAIGIKIGRKEAITDLSGIKES